MRFAPRGLLVNSSFATLSIIFGRGAVVGAGMLLSSNLGATAFAWFAFVHVTATAISNIASIGMQNAIPRYFAQLKLEGSATAAAHTVFAILIAVAGLAIAAIGLLLVPTELIGAPDPGLRPVLSVLLVLIGINNLAIGAANGLERFSQVSFATLIQGALLLVAIGISIGVHSVAVALWGYGMATATATVILFPAVVSYLRLPCIAGVLFNKALVAQVLQFCGPLFCATILFNSGVWLSGRSVLGREGGELEFAQFAIGLQWFGLAALASVVVSKVATPVLTRTALQGATAKRRDTVFQAVVLSAAAAAAILLFVMACPNFVLRLYGHQASGAKDVLQLFVLAAFLASPINVISSALVAEHKQIAVLMTTAIWWTSLLALLLILNDWGARGVAIAIGSSYALYLGAVVSAGVRFRIFREIPSSPASEV